MEDKTHITVSKALELMGKYTKQDLDSEISVRLTLCDIIYVNSYRKGYNPSK